MARARHAPPAARALIGRAGVRSILGMAAAVAVIVSTAIVAPASGAQAGAVAQGEAVAHAASVAQISTPAPTTIGAFGAVSVPDPPTTSSNALQAVSCPNAQFCMAVGSGTVNGFQFVGIGDEWNGTWSAVAPVDPEGSNVLSAVSCTSATFCMAVGSATTGVAFGAGDVLVEQWNGGAWSVMPAPDGSPNNEDNNLYGVSCTSSSFCVAVGDTGPIGATQALLEEWDGGQWTQVTASSVTLTQLDAVSCSSSSSCMAVGSGNGSAQLDGSTWSTDAGPQSLALDAPNLQGISCEDASTCTAVGTTSVAAGADLDAEQWDGHAWSVLNLPATTVQPLNALQSVSCVGSSCVVAGNANAQAVQFVLDDGTVRVDSAPIATQGTSIGGVSCTPTMCAGVGSDATAPIAETATVQPGTVTTPGPPTPPTAPTHGFWLVGGDGGIFTFGAAQFYGSTGSIQLQRPVVGITATADRSGYWLVASDGGIFTFGDAGFYGSIPGMGIGPAGSRSGGHLNAPIVAMVPSADGAGYFMVGSDGGVFAFGDARFAGSCPGIGGCAGSAVAVLPDATGNGYWLVTSSGNVYGFGDAAGHGAPGRHGVAVTSAVRTPDGGGYWILFADGTVDAFGDAPTLGSLGPGQAGALDPASAIFTTADGAGYSVVTADGAVYPFGDAPNDGGMTGRHLNAPIVAATGW